MVSCVPAWRRVTEGICALLLAVAIFAAPSKQAGAEGRESGDARVEQVVRSFDLVALRNEMVRVTPRVTKWTRALRIHVSEEIALTARERRILHDHLDRLAALTGLEMRFVDSERRANFRIHFTSRANYFDHIKRNLGRGQEHLVPRLVRSVCSAFYRATPSRREILKAVIIIPTDSARAQSMLRACIVEETTQMLGLPNDSDTLTHSIFNDSNGEVDMTALDEMLLRVLYHPRMIVGMNRSEALHMAREIVPAIQQDFDRRTIASTE